MIIMANNKGKCQVCPKLVESRCSWCKLVFYCSREHQKLDWKNHKEVCTKKKYRMEENERLGRYLVATEDIKADSFLFKDKPLVLSYKLDTLEFTGNKVCVGCYKEILLNKNDHHHPHNQGGKRLSDKEEPKGKVKVKPAPLLLLTKPSTDGNEVDKGNQGRVMVQSENNEENGDDENKDNDGNENRRSSLSPEDPQRGNERKEDGTAAAHDDNDADGKDESDESDNSLDEDNDEDGDDDGDDESSEEDDSDDEDEKVCLSCRLPICSALCSDQYFHKKFECKLLREAAAYYNTEEEQKKGEEEGQGMQQKQQQNSLSGERSKTTEEESGEEGKLEKVSSLLLSSSPLPTPHVEGSNGSRSSSGSNQESASLDTTCINNMNSARAVASAAPKNMITSISNGIRETLLRNLLYFRCLLLKHVNEAHWNQLLSLQSNEESRRNDVTSLEKTTRIFTLIKKTLAEINHPSMSAASVCKSDVHKLVGIVEINALHVSISQNLEVTGIFPTFSLLEHSCIPSVKYYLVPCSPVSSSSSVMTATGGGGGGEGGGEEQEKTDNKNESHKKSSKPFFELYCRSAVKLKSGDHLSVAYTNAMWNTEKRREFLKKEKYFWCECARCMDKFELGSNFSTILCPLQDCKAPSVPTIISAKTGGGGSGAGSSGGGGGDGAAAAQSNNASSNSPYEIQWKCTSPTCGRTCAAWQVRKVDTKLCEMVGKTKPSIEAYKECLSKMRELVHPDYYLCCIVTHSLIQMYGHDTATVHDKTLLEEKIKSCNNLISIYRKLDPGLAILNIYASVIFYELHSAILAMVGAEIDEDYHILRSNPESVNLALIYLQKCIDCFKYEFLELPENKLKTLAMKKMQYLNIVMSRR